MVCAHAIAADAARNKATGKFDRRKRMAELYRAQAAMQNPGRCAVSIARPALRSPNPERDTSRPARPISAGSPTTRSPGLKFGKDRVAGKHWEDSVEAWNGKKQPAKRTSAFTLRNWKKDRKTAWEAFL
jgi:hypothetical protein